MIIKTSELIPALIGITVVSVACRNWPLSGNTTTILLTRKARVLWFSSECEERKRSASVSTTGDGRTNI